MRVMPDPVVSVIMIFYNAAPFLGEAIASVRTQSLVDWELLLVDDGSSDGSSELAKAFAAGDPECIRYFEHDQHANLGTAVSRDLAFANARGEFVSKLDSDDVYLTETALAEQLRILRGSPEAAMAYCPCERWHSWQADSKKQDKRQVLTFSDELVESPRMLVQMLKRPDEFPFSFIIRSDAVRSVGGCASPIRDYGEDFVLFAKLMLRYPVYVAAQSWYRHRMHPQSITSRTSHREEREHFSRLYLWLTQYIRTEKLGDRVVRKALRASWLRPESWHRRLLNTAMADLRWAGFRLLGSVKRVLRHWQGLDPIRLEVSPSRVVIRSEPVICVVEVIWAVGEGEAVQVRYGAHDGPVFAATTGSGRQHTGLWVTDRAMFFLQDAAVADPARASATLAVARVRALARIGH